MHFRIIASAAMLTLSVASAQAESITYNETVTASGLLGGQLFKDALVTITGVGDTTDVSSPVSGILVVPVTASVVVAGIGAADFTDSTVVFVNQSGPDGGFSDNTRASDILDVVSKAFAHYDLTTSFGPASGPSITSSYSGVDTSVGGFLVLSIFSDVTFTATIGVPEPSSMVLAGTAILAGLGAWTRRRRIA